MQKLVWLENDYLKILPDLILLKAPIIIATSDYLLSKGCKPKTIIPGL